ncbi:hypothetical protein AZH11_10255 [Pseudomonas simiae]|nr:hypothetical protein AZH11_10255 [Pseudomonas simiae]
MSAITSLLASIGANFGSMGGSSDANKDLEDQRDKMQRKSFERSNKVYETNEAKKNAEAVR